MDTDFVPIGKALSAPARSAMMSLLLDGQPHSATELARVAGVAAGTASEHLAVLVSSAMVTAERRGRSRMFAIADADTAAALEALSRAPSAPVTSLRMEGERRRLRTARTCYDHLAGELGVHVTSGLRARGWFSDDLTQLLPAGERGLCSLGVEASELRRAHRTLLRPCLDWTEREHHVAGAVGAALADVVLGNGWAVRVDGSRSLRPTRTAQDIVSLLSDSQTSPSITRSAARR